MTWESEYDVMVDHRSIRDDASKHIEELSDVERFDHIFLVPDAQPSVVELPATRPAEDGLSEPARWLVSRLKAIKAADQLDWARKTLVPARVAIQIGEAVKAECVIDARAMADALVELDAEYAIGVSMRDALHDPQLAAADRDAKIAGLVIEARKAFDAVVRELKLRDRLDIRLYAFSKLGPPAATQPVGGGITLERDKLRVTVKAGDAEPDTLAALRSAGLDVEATAAPARLVVGRIAPEKLADLAVLDQVRRVIPTEGVN